MRRLTRLGGARLCYGRPVRAGEHTVITVASVRAMGGAQHLAGEPSTAADGRGGGMLHARPIGFIDVGPDGARFHRIDRPGRTALGVAAGAATLLLARFLVGGAPRPGAGVLRRPAARRRLPLPR